MANVKVVYNEQQKALELLLRTIDRPGDYCTVDRLLAPMPRVAVDGAGSLSFPITEEQARALASAGEQAPYGRGEQTLVDSKVRACRQVDAERVSMTGGAWDDTLDEVVDRAATGLGCPPERTSAHLYKLLVYEPGGFFAPHRDTEKVDGMVATLVVSLPAAGAGGELVIRHRQRSTVVDLSTDEPSELAFAAFYADCVHEIRPVTAGYRIVLVYHLVVRGAAAAVLQAAPDFDEQEEQVAAQLRSWEATSAAGDKLVWLLEHQYSEDGLSFDVLKNADSALGRVLARAAQRANHALYAAILSIYESGTVDEDGEYYDWDEDADDWDDWDALEDIDSTRSLLGLIAADGSRPDYGELPLLPGELLPSGALDDAEPDDEDAHVTGNEGVHVSRSYHRAALVLWPQARTLGTIARGGIEHAVAWFEDEVARSQDDAAARRNLPGLAAQLIDTWPAPDGVRFYRRDYTDGVPQACRDMLSLLRRLGDEATTRRFLCEVATPHYSGGETDELLATAAVVAPATLRVWLPRFTETNLPLAPEDVLDLLGRLYAQDDASAGSDRLRHPALADAARALCLGLPALVGAKEPDPDAGRPAERRPVRPLSGPAIRSLFAFLWHCAPPADVDAVAALLVQHPAAAPPHRAVPEALAKLAELRGTTGDAVAPAGVVTLWRHAASCLLARSAAPPEEPRDWVIEASIPHRCPLCARLQAFCDAPQATTERFRVRQDLRQHVESMIARERLDIGCRTERSGSPHTLICTKNRASYRRRCAEYAADVVHMRLLVDAAPRSGTNADCGVDLQRLRQATADDDASDG